MKLAVEIPRRMAHLKVDGRGYPIPYFVPYVNGVPDFRYQDQKKQQACAKHNLCSICGKPLVKKVFWFISGPMGLANAVHSDAPMHEECARFSIAACPHLAFFKAERRTNESPDPNQIGTKPSTLFLVKANRCEFIMGRYFKFRPVRAEEFKYENNKLVPTAIIEYA